MTVVREKNIQLFHEIPEEIKMLTLCGDQIKLQLVLSDFLLNVVQYAPVLDGWVEIKISAGLKLIQDGNEHIHLQIRYSSNSSILLVHHTFFPVLYHIFLYSFVLYMFVWRTWKRLNRSHATMGFDSVNVKVSWWTKILLRSIQSLQWKSFKV